MKNSKLVVLEGMSGGGKTTAMRTLLQNCPSLECVNIKSTSFFDALSGISLEAKANPSYYQIIDHLKSLLVDSSEQPFVLLERYYLSTIAHSYALCEISGSYEDYKKMLAWYQAEINNHLRTPDAYIFFDISPVEARERIDRRNEPVLDPIWIDRDYMEICESFKRSFVRVLEPSVKTLTVNASFAPDMISAQIDTFIRNL